MDDPAPKSYQFKDSIYKILLFLISVCLLGYLFQRKHLFRYEFRKGYAWNYPDLIAPFDFALFKSSEEYSNEIKEAKANKKYHFNKDRSVLSDAIEELNQSRTTKNKPLIDKAQFIIFAVYQYGYLDPNALLPILDKNSVIAIRSDSKILNDVPYAMVYTRDKVNDLIDKSIPSTNPLNKHYNQTLKRIIAPDLSYDEKSTEKFLKRKIAAISKVRGLVHKDKLIISEDEIVNDDKFQMLLSLKKAYENQPRIGEGEYLITLGYFLLSAIILSIFFIYLHDFQKDIYENDRELTFLILNILLTILVTVKILDNYPALLYLVPFCIVPIIIRAFFNFELSIFIHLINIFLISITISNAFEFAFMQINAGLVALLTQKTIFKRINLFITAGKVVGTYILIYFGLTLIREGTLENISRHTYIRFIFNGALILFAQPLIYIFEKLFRLTSDLSLLELSDTKVPLLRMLSQRAPGTLQHSLTVATLAEEAALETGANPLLTRIGALYHDIGKIKNPFYFRENQQYKVTPHEGVDLEESTRIILGHVPEGRRLAKEHHLPDRIIDFIRSDLILFVC